MKTFKTIAACLLALTVLQARAQNETADGYTSGSITLTDGTVKTGFIKDNAAKKGSISYAEAAGAKAKKFDGWQLTAAAAGATRYTCIKGDFFTVLCQGELCYLQKVSEAAGKIDYVGNEPILRAASEGKRGDYFLYSNLTKELVLVTRASYNQVAAQAFNNYEPAIARARELNQDMAALQQAVEIYNKRPAK